MRIGGPYRIEAIYLGFADYVKNNVFLQLGETYVLDVQLSESETALEELVITGSATKFTTEKTGPSTNVNNEQMRLLPTISRSIADIARLSPYANSMGFAGSDGRSTNFTVDGANLNNNFGLSSSLPGGGNPISIDAIEEVQVVIAPFDVRQTNFIGGGINAITKSGTNTFKGSAYTFFRNQDMRGNRIGEHDFGVRNEESRTVRGATLGGPIVRDKLFFFGNIEYEKSPQQVVKWRASTDGVTDHQTVSRVTEADLKKVSDFLRDKYGYDTGSYTDFPADESNLKYLLRLDWNINNANKFSLRYNHTKNTGWNPPNGNSTDGAYRDNTKDRISEWSMSYANSMYSMDNLVNSATAELNSRIGENISNQFLATYSLIKDVRGSTSEPFPFIDIMSGDVATGTAALNPYISAGHELFTWNNGVTNKITTITDNFTYYYNAHKLTAGLSYEYQYADNNYMRNGTGYYRYASLSDFLNGAAPVDFALTYGANGNTLPSNAVSFGQFGGYLQDEWNLRDNLKLTAGVRADNLTFLNDIMTNNAIKELDFGGRHIDTGVWPQSRINWSPRLGFTYDALKDKTWIVRGGTGLFTGRLPLVFFTNMPSNAGMNQLLMKVQTKFKADGSVDTRDGRLDLLKGDLITNVDEMISKLGFQTEVTPDMGSKPSSIAGVAPDFKMPQVWKTALGVDYQIPVSFPLSLTAEGTYTKNINAVTQINYAIKDPESSWDRFAGPDNRYIYPAGNDRYHVAGTTDACVLSNTNKGHGYTLNFTMKAEPVQNLDVMAAYTHTEMKEISGLPGSNANSAWVNIYSVNGPNHSDVQRSQYVIPNQLIGSISYRLPDRDYKSTTFSLFYRGYSPYGDSFLYTNDMNGDGVVGDLIYIPKEKGDIRFVSQADEDAFFAFMEQDSYLSRHKGEYAEAYASRAPWVHKFDLRILQDFYVKVGHTKHTFQLSLDALNVGNMLNSSWGVNRNMAASNYGKVLKYEGRDASNVPTFSMIKIDNAYPVKTYDTYLSYGQCWSLQVGLRYLFN
jgi:outer membrane receptor protein involved in Fe transport